MIFLWNAGWMHITDLIKIILIEFRCLRDTLAFYGSSQYSEFAKIKKCMWLCYEMG